MKNWPVLIAFLFISTGVFACLNYYYGVDKEGHLHETNREAYEQKLNKNFNIERIAGKLPALEEKIREKGDYKELSDYAVYLLKLGRYEVALELFKALQAAHPDDYELAANLGTAYELNGDNDNALKFIELGMDLNPNAHSGSEWVHISVLETKLALAKDSAYLKSHTVLGLTEAQEKDTAIRDQIWIQIYERFPFTPPGDPIMASLLIDLGDCFANTTSVEYARAFYQVAQKYHADSSQVLGDKISEVTTLMNNYESVHPDHNWPPLEAMHNKLGYTRYDKMMDDFTKDPPYEVNWDEINLDADSLLSYVGLEVIKDTTGDYVATETSKGRLPAAQRAKNDWLIWILLGGGVVIMIAMYFFLRKR